MWNWDADPIIHKGRAAIRHFANLPARPLWPLRRRPNFTSTFCDYESSDGPSFQALTGRHARQPPPPCCKAQCCPWCWAGQWSIVTGGYRDGSWRLKVSTKFRGGSPNSQRRHQFAPWHFRIYKDNHFNLYWVNTGTHTGCFITHKTLHVHMSIISGIQLDFSASWQ